MRSTPSVPSMLAAFVTVLAAALPAQAQRLPRLDIHPGEVTVSGLSSGGYMAVQFQIAHSASVAGAGVIAGGPFRCAAPFAGSVFFPFAGQATAMSLCSCSGDVLGGKAGRDACTVNNETATAAHVWLPLVSVEWMRWFDRADWVDPRSHLAGHRVWLFSGAADRTVPPSLVRALRDFYTSRAVGIDPARVRLVDALPDAAGAPRVAGHGMPVLDRTRVVPCEDSAPPYLNDCGYDASGELLRWLHPSIPAGARGTARAEGLRRFDQRPFLPARQRHGLDDTGFVYVPADCEGGAARCRLHVVFHGCRQAAGYRQGGPGSPNGEPFGDAFARHAGYNEWAEANRIVVLYPQVKPADDLFLPNPRGCWDFWGYSGTADFGTKRNAQVCAVKGMIDRLVSGRPSRDACGAD